jgi:hypothetical protein
MVTQLEEPSKDRAPPDFPAVHAAPRIVPVLPFPDSSATVEPDPPSKL